MISIVYSCMGREDNLVQSIYSWLSLEQVTEIIIVDWSCEKKLIDNTAIRSIDIAKVVRVNNQKHFSLPKSYNLAIKYATNKIILKLDCDYINVNQSWINYLRFNKQNELDNYFIVGDWRFAQSLNGFMLVNKKDFLGYNENMVGWGYEDDDLYSRMAEKITKIPFFSIKDYVYHIPHDDISRTVNYSVKDKHASQAENIKISNTEFTYTTYESVLNNDGYIELIEK